MPKRIKDITGQRFGKLIALYPTEKRKNGSVVWHCQCDCGNTKDVSVKYLTSGNTKSCGCQKINDLTGKRFGKLTVLYSTEKRIGGNVVWHCQCDCGEEKDISGGHLISGYTKSCGCLKKRDITNQRFGKLVALYPTKKRRYGYVVWHCQCDCGNTKDVTATSLLEGVTTSCGCIVSKGEEKIIQCLNNLKIKYEKEKKFKDCVNPKTNWPLRFDFFLSDYNCCIEYDGKQHYETVDFFSRCSDTLDEKQYRDNIKNNFCKEHNIKLIRISYFDYDKINNNFILKLLE